MAYRRGLAPVSRLWRGNRGWGVLGTRLLKWLLYLKNDGPSVGRFRGLADEIGAGEAQLRWHLEQRRTSIGAVRNASEASRLTIQLNLLLGRIEKLGIQPPDFRPISDPLHQKWLASYLSAFALLAQEGELEKARSTAPGWLAWESLGAEKSDADARAE